MISIPITIREDSGCEKVNEFFSLGVPFPKGKLEKVSLLNLEDSYGEPVPVQIKATSSWPDGSVRWCFVTFLYSLTSRQLETLLLSDNERKGKVVFEEIKVTDSPERILIDTGKAEFTINKSIFSPFGCVAVDGASCMTSEPPAVVLTGMANASYVPVVDKIHYDTLSNPVTLSVSIKGFFRSELGERFFDFSALLTFFLGSSTAKIDFTIHNPKPAHHPGGLWDVGDAGSRLFESLVFKFPVGKVKQSYWKDQNEGSWQQADGNTFELVQASSGGDNWGSVNHIDRSGSVRLKYRGYRYFVDGVNTNTGDRASPTFCTQSGTLSTNIFVKDFWQNFPKSIGYDGECLNVGLFPPLDDYEYELQGGEKKTHSAYIDFGDNKNALQWCASPSKSSIELDQYVQASILPYLTVKQPEGVLDDIVNEGIIGNDNFFIKREHIDEYGWRNFGDVFADHESLYLDSDEVNISHYNNQYDAIGGFARQYVLSGDQRWFELMDNLASHVSDIDIYHTTDDREEYSGGLFWHTDHYVSAHTSTHRTFSLQHQKPEDSIVTGGGPGAEHCYSNGLLNHYFITGSEPSKSSVESLVDWSIATHEGSDSVLARLLTFKNKELPKVKRLIAGDSVARYKYPFTRGTGNYISTLIDGYWLTNNTEYIELIERIIANTFHPNDDISSRKLKNIESTWSHTVFLQSVIKYLDLKKTFKDGADDSFLYARDALLHYAEWMLDNDIPYLDRSDRLDYPNHTWVAQEIRKVNILYSASQYSTKNKVRFLQRASFYLKYTEDMLKTEKTRTFSRILILLMQNHGPHALLETNFTSKFSDKEYPVGTYSAPPFYTLKTLFTEVTWDILRKLSKLSISKEVRWFKTRTRP